MVQPSPNAIPNGHLPSVSVNLSVAAPSWCYEHELQSLSQKELYYAILLERFFLAVAKKLVPDPGLPGFDTNRDGLPRITHIIAQHLSTESHPMGISVAPNEDLVTMQAFKEGRELSYLRLEQHGFVKDPSRQEWALRIHYSFHAINGTHEETTSRAGQSMVFCAVHDENRVVLYTAQSRAGFSKRPVHPDDRSIIFPD